MAKINNWSVGGAEQPSPARQSLATALLCYRFRQPRKCDRWPMVMWQLHYLHDFLFMGSPIGNSCGESLEVALKTCRELGVPVASLKTEGPATQLTFLGIQMDTETMTLSLPEDKLTRILGLVLSWRGKKTATRRQLQSLIGHLNHAALVVLPGRTFMRRMVDLMKVANHPSHHVRLTADFKSDLQWWASFLPKWNGRSIMPPHAPSHMVTSDDSGSWGYGAVMENGNWFQVQWPGPWMEIAIAAKEMVPVVISAAVWGVQWAKCRVLVRSDNMAVVYCLTTGSARDPLLMHLLCCLYYITASYQIDIVARHVPGVLNTAADALSRNSMTTLFNVTPQARAEATQIPDTLLDILFHQRPDWTSLNWRKMFLTSWDKH